MAVALKYHGRNYEFDVPMPAHWPDDAWKEAALSPWCADGRQVLITHHAYGAAIYHADEEQHYRAARANDGWWHKHEPIKKFTDSP